MKSINDLSLEQKKMLVNEILNKDQTGNEWNDICQSFDLAVHPDTIRKMAPGIRIASQVFNSGDTASYIERQKMRDINSKINAELRKESRSELLRQIVRESIKALPDIQQFDVCECDSGQQDRQLVLCIGDTHFGADINCLGLYGEQINRFNEQIFVQRMNQLLVRAVGVLQKQGINHVSVFLVGDLIDGILRQSQLTRLEYGLVEQVIRFSEIMANWLNRLSSYCHVHVVGVSGNHSEIRPLNSKARQFEEQNLEKIIFWYLKARFENNNRVVVRQVCNRMQVCDVMGHSFLLLHGDGEKKIQDIAKSVVNLYNQPIEYFVCGHLHKLSEYPAGITPGGSSQIIRVPSICGMDSYAQSKGYGGRPGALALVIEQNYGCVCKYPIWLD